MSGRPTCASAPGSVSRDRRCPYFGWACRRQSGMVSRVALLASLVAPALTGCLDAEAVGTTVEEPTGAVDCVTVLDDGVAAALGWPIRLAGGKVVAEDSRCVWRLNTVGEISVWSVKGTGSVVDRFDDACGRLTESGPLDAELKQQIVGAAQACVVGLDPEIQTGTAELVLFTVDGVLLDMRVVAEAPLAPEQQLAGLRALSKSAQDAW